MERHSIYAALTDAVGSLLLDLVENSLNPRSVAVLTSLRSLPLAERDSAHDHAAICRSGGRTPGTFAVAMSPETAQTLSAMALGEMGEVTPAHTASFMREFAQWIASRALPRLGVTDLDFLQESVSADSLAVSFPADCDSAWLLIESELGQLHVGASFVS
jgi:hypothetical protein